MAPTNHTKGENKMITYAVEIGGVDTEDWHEFANGTNHTTSLKLAQAAFSTYKEAALCRFNNSIFQAVICESNAGGE